MAHTPSTRQFGSWNAATVDGQVWFSILSHITCPQLARVFRTFCSGRLFSTRTLPLPLSPPFSGYGPGGAHFLGFSGLAAREMPFSPAFSLSHSLSLSRFRPKLLGDVTFHHMLLDKKGNRQCWGAGRHSITTWSVGSVSSSLGRLQG